MKLNEMSFMSDVARGLEGRLSGKEHIRSVALRSLQRIERNLDPRSLRRMGVEDERLIGWLRELRNDAVEAIETIRGVEK